MDNHQTGKRGYDPHIGICSVIIPAKGIRRDIEILAKPKLRRKADLLRNSVRLAGDERQQFGAIHAALVSLVDEHPHNKSGIEAAALTLHEWTQDCYFVVEGYVRDAGISTDYTKIEAESDEDAKRQIDAMRSAQTVAMMDMIHEARSSFREW